MAYQKNLIIAIVIILLAGGVWLADTWYAPTSSPPTNSQEVMSPQPPKAELKPSPQLKLTKTLFHYDIVIGKTPCGDKIGSFDVVSSDPSARLYWRMTGAKPIWLTFSQVEGETPATVDMAFNCILSGAEEMIDWTFTVVEITKEGKYVDGYALFFTLRGDIVAEAEQMQ